MKLIVRHDYRNQDIYYPANHTIEVSDEMARFLLADAGGCFEVVRDIPDPLTSAPVDRMVHKAPKAR